MFKRKRKMQAIDTRLYKYWQALYMCFYSQKLYIDVAKRWRGLGIKYYLLFFIVATIPYALKCGIDMNTYIKRDYFEPVSLLPKFTIVSGEVKFDKPMPYLVKNVAGKTVAIIDTTGSITDIKEEYPDVLVLVEKTQMQFKFPKLFFLENDSKNERAFNQVSISTHDLSEIDYEVFDGKEMLKEYNMQAVKNHFLLFVYPVVIFGLFGLFTTTVMALSIMGQVAAYAIFKHKMTFKQACRVAIVASSVGIWTYLLLKTFNLASLQLNLGCVVLVFIYFSYGVLAIKRDSRHLVHY